MAKRERRSATEAGPRRPKARGRFDRQSLLVTLSLCLGLLIAVAIIFAQTLRFEFVNYDDKGYVYQNAHVHKGITWRGFAWAFGSFYQFNWHPLTWLSHMADYQMYPLWPGGHHLTSVLLHSATVLLLFLLLLQMTGQRWPSAGVSALFAVHPLHVESVAWVAERKDVLSGFFFMLTLTAYAYYVRRQSRARYSLVVLCFALGLLAKPMLVTLPFVLLLLDYWPLQRLDIAPSRPSTAEDAPHTDSIRQVVREKVPLLAMAFASCIVTWFAQRGAIKPLDHFPFMGRVSNALVSYGTYLIEVIWPAGLAAHYPYVNDQPTWAVATSLGLIAAISLAAIVWRRRFPYLLVGWLWFLGMLVPVIGLVQVGDQARADRYMYLPLIGPALALAWGITDFARTSVRRRICGAASAVALAALTVAAWRQVDYWRDSESLWTRAVSCTSGNWMALTNLGSLHMRKADRLDEAIGEFNAALAIRQDLSLTEDNLAVALVLRGDLNAAFSHFQKARDISPDVAHVYNDFALALASAGQTGLAIGYYEQALRIQPEYAEAHSNLALALQNAGQPDAALDHLRTAVKIWPDDAEACNNLGFALYLKGQFDEAIFYLERAVALKPEFAIARQNLAFVKQARAALQQNNGGGFPNPPPH